jgi:hypothetical protein
VILGANLGKVGILGVESGITDPFLDQAPWGVGFPQVASTGDTRLLEFGELDDFGCLIGKWKSDFI